MKKKIDTMALANELNQTGFFRRPSPPQEPVRNAPPPAEPTPAVQPVPIADSAPSAPPYGRTPVRRLTRVPFELYQDQLDRLRKIALDAKVRGEKGSMSEMVRHAIDKYLAENHPE